MPTRRTWLHVTSTEGRVMLLRLGVPLTVTLTNRGTERHELSFEALHMPGLRWVESILEPGGPRTITLLLDAPVTHTFICSVPGHAAAGMTGAAFVTP